MIIHRTLSVALASTVFLSLSCTKIVPKPTEVGSTTLELTTPSLEQFPEKVRPFLTHSKIQVFAEGCDKAEKNKVLIETFASELDSIKLDSDCSYRIGIQIGTNTGTDFVPYYGNFETALSEAKFSLDNNETTIDLLDKSEVAKGGKINAVIAVRSLAAAKAILGRSEELTPDPGTSQSDLSIKVIVDPNDKKNPGPDLVPEKEKKEESADQSPVGPLDPQNEGKPSPKPAKNNLSLDQIRTLIQSNNKILVKG